MSEQTRLPKAQFEYENKGDVRIIRLKPMDAELPILRAVIEKIVAGDERMTAVDFFIGDEDDSVGHMCLWRAPSYAVPVAKAALKGFMSRRGKHRRMTANRAARKAAERSVA